VGSRITVGVDVGNVAVAVPAAEAVAATMVAATSNALGPQAERTMNAIVKPQHAAKDGPEREWRPRLMH